MSDTDSDDVDTDTHGIEVLAAAKYQAFEDVIDRVAAERSVDRNELRNAVAHWVDTDLEATYNAHDMPRRTLVECRDRCDNAAEMQYPGFY